MKKMMCWLSAGLKHQELSGQTTFNKQAHLKEIKQWYLQFPNVIGQLSQELHFVVLDADTQEACDFCESGQITRTTLKQKTPRGGYHYFYAINAT